MKNTTITVIVVLLILASGGLFLFWKGKKTSKPAAGSPEQLAEARAAKAKKRELGDQGNTASDVERTDQPVGLPAPPPPLPEEKKKSPQEGLKE